ncbi:MAG: phosphoribosylformylglycinamidine synthase subunit PurQ [Pseudanabaenaceae cyanobacterium SKYGB_i_bin29]|nr:phosphoribosylformylglycinamidine synthase subunit PurQ [Pseudanabaenaceae cyanobacterium SKYG29]MDW8421506.1 phosphoribosylformylglycinamidine synthase subunit PurQ [Pseudanabaenaceae cyanobacterium SKYGB_i_bin29]
MKFGVVVFPGSNCDRDVAWVTQGLLGQKTVYLWHRESALAGVDVVILPGGFSYGDYLRCGALARSAPILRAVVDHAHRGGYVLGICNGFQILTEVGLLPGALVRNRNLHFICDRVRLRVERTDLSWTRNYDLHQIITLPIAHGEGCYYADRETLTRLQDNRQVVWRYVDNPNGSLQDIAGICNPQGNVLGMMPHPERAADRDLGSTDGLGLFTGLLASRIAV